MAGKDYRREQVQPGVYKIIRQDDGEWVSTQIYYRTADRKQRVKTFSGPNTLTAARKFKADIDRKEPEQRVDPTAGRMTLGDVYDEQLASRPFAEKTLAIRRQVRNMTGLKGLFTKRLNAIGRQDVNEAIDAATKAPGMAREIRKSLRSAFTYAAEVRCVEFPKGNPARSSGLRSTVAEKHANGDGSQEPDYIPTREEIARLIAEMPDRYKVFVEMLARTGVRWHSEGAMLRVRNFDPVKRELCVYATKTGRTRCFPIPGDLSEKISEHIARYVGWDDPEALVFTSESGGPIDAHNWRRRIFTPAARRAGITYQGFRPYDLRHFACSTALEEGISATVVAAMSGHSVDMLHRTYAHALQEAQTRAAEVLEAAWNRPLKSEGEVVPLRTEEIL